MLRGIDLRLDLEPDPADHDWVVTYDGLEARGLAELLASEAGPTLKVGVGRSPRPLPRVIEEVSRLRGIDPSSATVRGGFTRGHLLELVVALPPSPADPQELAEELVDAVLGDALVDDWVAAVAATPLPPSGPLRVLQPSSKEPPTYPLSELGALLASATGAVDALLPDTPYWKRPVGAEWVWLELEPGDQGPQADRLAVVTWLPELLKCALEGLPFHSRRFSRWGERFVWIRTSAPRGAERLERRERVERALDTGLRRAGQGALVGTGFGERHDYFDLCLCEGDDALHALFTLARELRLGSEAPTADASAAELGFYDSRWSEERLLLG